MRFYRFLKRSPFLPTKRMTRMNGGLSPCSKPGRRRLFHPNATEWFSVPMTKRYPRSVTVKHGFHQQAMVSGGHANRLFSSGQPHLNPFPLIVS